VSRTVRIGVGVVMVAVMLGGCSQPLSTREKGTLWGGGIGAASGAIIGAAVGHPGAGAAIGGGMGALTGGLIGDQLQGQENRTAYQQRQINQQSRALARQQRDIEQLKRRSVSDNEY
jgi:uncharacterized protein YcfJ